jgi:hypothetical protein
VNVRVYYQIVLEVLNIGSATEVSLTVVSAAVV